LLGAGGEQRKKLPQLASFSVVSAKALLELDGLWTT